MTEEFENAWEDFGLHMGPFGFGFWGPKRSVRYSRTENFHIIRLRIGQEITKEQIKVRLIRPGVLEIEWPRQPQGEEIPIE